MIKTGTIINYELIYDMIMNAPRNFIDMFKKEKVVKEEYEPEIEIETRGSNISKEVLERMERERNNAMNRGISDFLIYGGKNRDVFYINTGTIATPVYRKISQEEREDENEM